MNTKTPEKTKQYVLPQEQYSKRVESMSDDFRRLVNKQGLNPRDWQPEEFALGNPSDSIASRINANSQKQR